MASTQQLRRDIALNMAAGKKDSEIAELLGITQSYIAQLQNDAAFKAMLASYNGQEAEADILRDRKLDEIQDGVLEIIHGNIPIFVKSTKDAISLFKMANEAKRSTGKLDRSTNANTVVQVNMPTFLINECTVVEHKTNENNEVIEVDGRALITQDSKTLTKELDSFKERRTEKILNQNKVTLTQSEITPNLDEEF